MSPRDSQATILSLRDQPLKVDTYFLQQTGFLPHQTILKLGEYNVTCVPASLGSEEARFLAVLSPTEVHMFSKFQEGTHILILSFDRPGTKDIVRFPLRVGLREIEVVPERKNVCILVLKLKTMPDQLVLFLSKFLDTRDEKLAIWEQASQEWELCDLKALTGARIGPNILLMNDDKQRLVTIEALQSRALRFDNTEGLSDWVGRQPSSLKFSFQGKIITLDGELKKDREFLLEFHPDWLECLEAYRFQQDQQARSTKKATS